MADYKDFGKFKIGEANYGGMTVQATVPDPNPLNENFHDYMKRNDAQSWAYFLVVQPDNIIRVIYDDCDWVQGHPGCEIIGIQDIGDAPMVDLPRPSWDEQNGVIMPGIIPPQPAPDISLRQFYQLCAERGYISRQEALDGLQGQIPEKIMNIIQKLSADDLWRAQMLLIGAVNVDSTNILVNQIAAAMNFTAADVQSFFTEAAAL